MKSIPSSEGVLLLRALALCCAATAAAALLDVARDGSVRVDGALWLAAAIFKQCSDRLVNHATVIF